jgi:hypothetical protein
MNAFTLFALGAFTGELATLLYMSVRFHKAGGILISRTRDKKMNEIDWNMINEIKTR